jgi:hypothetical protein
MTDDAALDFVVAAELFKLQDLERMLRQDGWKGPQDCSSAYYLHERLSAPPASTPEER